MKSFLLTAIFSGVILGGYAVANLGAYDPFATSSDTRQLPPTMSTGHRTGGAVFWYGGFSGGK